MKKIVLIYHATFSKTSGISEAARANFSALEDSSFIIKQINYIENKGQLIKENLHLIDDINDITINVYHVNINDIPSFLLNNSIPISSNIYNIAYWTWEFNKLPEEFIDLLPLFDEIWVPSSFCQNIFASFSFKPVIKIPHLIESIEVKENKPKIKHPRKKKYQWFNSMFFRHLL
jgi:hypothetical protein